MSGNWFDCGADHESLRLAAVLENHRSGTESSLVRPASINSRDCSNGSGQDIGQNRKAELRRVLPIRAGHHRVVSIEHN